MTDAERSIVVALAGSDPGYWNEIVDEKECALCRDWMSKHTDETCPWLRALDVVLNGSAGMTDAELVDAIESKVGPLSGNQILVLRGDFDEDLAEHLIGALVDAARERGLAGPAVEYVPLVVLLADGQTLELLDEDDMRSAGWIRA